MKTIVVNLKYDAYYIYIGRGSKWGNPFPITPIDNRECVINKYEEYLLKNDDLLNSLSELVGKRLGCYCKPLACHGDILIKYIKLKGLE